MALAVFVSKVLHVFISKWSDPSAGERHPVS